MERFDEVFILSGVVDLLDVKPDNWIWTVLHIWIPKVN